MPSANVREEFFHEPESRGGRATGTDRVGSARITRVNRLRVKQLRFHGWHARPYSSSRPHIAQHQAGAAGAEDAVTEIVGLPPRLDADPDLVEGPGAAAAKQRAEQHRIPLAD